MASAGTDDVRRVPPSLQNDIHQTPTPRCGSGHASLRAFVTAHTSPRPTFGSTSTLSHSAPRTIPESLVKCGKTTCRDSSDSHSSQNGPSTVFVFGAESRSVSNSGSTYLPASRDSSCHDSCQILHLKARKSHDNSMVNREMTSYQDISSTTSSCSSAVSNTDLITHSHLSPSSLRHPGTTVHSRSCKIQPHATDCPHRGIVDTAANRTVFGPDAPKLQSCRTTKNPVKHNMSTPKRPRELVAVEEVISLLATCRADEHAISDVDRATDMLARFHVLGKRPRVERGHDEDVDSNDLLQSTVSSSPPASSAPFCIGECECHQSDMRQSSNRDHVSGIASDTGVDVSLAFPVDVSCDATDSLDTEERQDELCFLVTRCDIDSDVHESQFMPYIV